MPRRDTWYVMATILLCSILVAFISTTYGKRDDRVYDRFQTLATVLKYIEEKYVDQVDEDELMYGAIEGMMNKLDPHSVFLPPDIYKDFFEDMKGAFGGLGIEITLDENKILTVVTPIEDTPAWREGVLAGDRIIEIEGETTKGMTTEEAIKSLRGEPGTKVTITLLNPKDTKPRTLTLTRAEIKVESVKGIRRNDQDHWDYMLDPQKKIGYIRVTSFREGTMDEFKKAVETLQGQGVQSLVLDLRNNPGGYLSAAIEMSDMFVNEGVIVSTKGREGEMKPVGVAHKFGTLPEFDMVVLINGFSASASEIVSGALQDHKRAVLVGERSFGKGTVQRVIELEGGQCALKITTDKYYLPSGRSIQRSKDGKTGGVIPDIEVVVKEDDLPQLFNLWRKQGAHKNSPVPEPPLPGVKEDPNHPFVDTQLNRAVDYLNDVQVQRKLEEPGAAEAVAKPQEKPAEPAPVK